MSTPSTAHSNPSGWADDRLMQAYDLIEAVVDRCEDITDVIDGIVVEQV